MLSGCGKVLPAKEMHSVQIDALVPLHPAYSQIAMETEIVRTTAREAASVSLPQPHSMAALPPAFAAGELAPPSLAQERERRIAEDSRRYLALLEDSLMRRNAEILEREERAGNKQVVVETEAERAKREQALREKFAQERAQIEQDRHPLQARQVALESQARVYSGMMQTDAKLQLGTLRKRLNALDERLAKKADSNVPALVAQELQPFIKEQQAELAGRLQNRRKRLEDEIEDRLKREKLRLAAEAESIPDLRESVMPPSSQSDRPLPPISAPSVTVFAQAKPRLDAAVAQAQFEQTPERARLLSVLRADTQKAVEQVAIHEGWKLVPAGTPGATDYTPHAANALREQWK